MANKISSLQQRFLLEGSDEVRKISWVKWEDVCRPKKEGGMGVRDVTKFNIALLGKWRWRLLVERDSLWVKVLCVKYGRGVSSIIICGELWGMGVVCGCGRMCGLGIVV